MIKNTSLFHPRTMEHALAHLPATIPAFHKQVLQGWANSIRSGEIKRQNETNYDSVFIQQIMVGVLGYQDFSPGNHCTLKKNLPVGSGNVDIALGKFSEDETVIIAPFELKGAKTSNLDAIMPGRHKSPVQQAWEYAMDAPGARWVLVSNYLEIRLYAVGYGRVDYECFDLSTLTNPEEYKRFILLLSAENLLGTRTLELLKASEQVGKDITIKLYDDYRRLRETLIKSLKTDNPEVSELNIISYTQTLLDRILFIAFAQDRELIPKETLKKAFETQNPYHPVPIWENFKGLFRAIDKGSPPLNIPGYNGGLFAHDEGIELLQLSDALCGGFKKLGDYDFESDVSVNILGHIFEQSITDLEEIKAHATDNVENFDKKTSKRKRNGIFYTPPYITRYIVEQAVGGWLNDRKKEIGFDELPELTDEDYATIQLNTRGKSKGKVIYNNKVELHIRAWEAYEEALSSIKVLDPACGSGAFLNETFDYLYREGQLVNNELMVLNAGQAKLFRWDTHILANNIYGVDINRESVEITKLSLWLKTANRSEKLTYLDDNIKSGNSLIDDPAIAGSLAFKWEDEFSGIMSAGGFDVVVGNPPYGAALTMKDKKYIKENYKTTTQNFDSYISFFELSINLLKKQGFLGFITPNTYLVTENSGSIRKLLLQDNTLMRLFEIFDVFPDAIVEPIITIVKNDHPQSEHKVIVTTTVRKKLDFSDKISSAKEIAFGQKEIEENQDLIFNYRSKYESKQLANKLKNFPRLFQLATVKAGVKLYEKGKGLPPQTEETLQIRPYSGFEKKNDQWSPLIRGTDVKRYLINWLGEYVRYGEWLAAPRAPDLFKNPKIVIRRTDDKLMASYDEAGMIGVNSVHCVQLLKQGFSLKYLLPLLNSKLLNWFFQFENFHMVGKPLAEVKVVFVERLPIAECNKSQQCLFIEKAEIMLTKNKALHEISSKFLALLESEFNLDKPSSKLEQWYALDFATFMAELAKKKITLSLAQKTEWMEYFDKQKAIAAALKATIDTTDRTLDQMVYTLYALTPDEITIVEEVVHSNKQ